jgi:hypothetical protein
LHRYILLISGLLRREIIEYIEYYSVCPFVEIGPPSPASECVSHLGLKRGSNTRLRVRGRRDCIWTTGQKACEFRLFWAPNGTRLSARCRLTGPKKVSISRAQPPPTCPRNGCCPHQKHYARGRINHKGIIS